VTKPILLLGESWGEYESRIRSAFVGPSGIELLRMLNDAGIIHLTFADRDYINEFYRFGDPRAVDSVWGLHPEVRRSNVFNIHPPANRLEHFCGPRDQGIIGWGPLLAGKYVRREFEPELDRLADEILGMDPDLIIALGNTALWALTGRTGVTKLRGTTMLSSHTASGYKLLPTYHPAAVLREWPHRPTTVRDLIKAGRESAFPEIRRPKCEIWIEPTLEDIRTFIDAHIRNCAILSVDIETSGSRITCIGFAPSPTIGIVIPFDDERAVGRSYWPNQSDERSAWELIRGVLECDSIRKLFQNGLYDIAFLWRAYGIGVMGAVHDTMLLSHALQPESLKGLGYLGSIYTDHGAWKSERKHVETIGRDK
jgi:uracil-DNA glycosylase